MSVGRESLGLSPFNALPAKERETAGGSAYASTRPGSGHRELRLLHSPAPIRAPRPLQNSRARPAAVLTESLPERHWYATRSRQGERKLLP